MIYLLLRRFATPWDVRRKLQLDRRFLFSFVSAVLLSIFARISLPSSSVFLLFFDSVAVYIFEILSYVFVITLYTNS